MLESKQEFQVLENELRNMWTRIFEKPADKTSQYEDIRKILSDLVLHMQSLLQFLKRELELKNKVIEFMIHNAESWANVMSAFSKGEKLQSNVCKVALENELERIKVPIISNLTQFNGKIDSIETYSDSGVENVPSELTPDAINHDTLLSKASEIENGEKTTSPFEDCPMITQGAMEDTLSIRSEVHDELECGEMDCSAIADSCLDFLQIPINKTESNDTFLESQVKSISATKSRGENVKSCPFQMRFVPSCLSLKGKRLKVADYCHCEKVCVSYGLSSIFSLPYSTYLKYLLFISNLSHLTLMTLVSSYGHRFVCP